MPDTFPTLLLASSVAPLLLRFALAAILFYLGKSSFLEKRICFTAYFEARRYPLAIILPWLWGCILICVSLFLMFGFMTQIAALLSVYIIMNLMLIENRSEKIFYISQHFYVVMMIIAISLLFSGAGIFAVDTLLQD
jgi:uncharacterized membrane protein YphA (DoxX/SURF4 family)